VLFVFLKKRFIPGGVGGTAPRRRAVGDIGGDFGICFVLADVNNG
jgi:hypothetical protein